MSKWMGAIIGGLEIGLATVGEFFAPGNPLSTYLYIAGGATVLGSLGTMLTKGPVQGIAASARNPVAPWNVIYGRARVGGTVVYINSFGDSDKWLDLVIVLAAHRCQSVDALYFDNSRVQIGDNNTSFSPLQQTIGIFDIARAGSVVTVVLHSDIPSLIDGDQVDITDVTGDLSLNGRFPVTILSRVGSTLTFTYLCGGPASHVTNQGHCTTTWADFGRKVYMETLLGTQTLGQNFPGMLNGTPEDGDPGNLALVPGGSTRNPWTANCSLVGKTAVHLRLHYNDAIFSNGLPQISFRIHGKNDISDPRTSPPTIGYTENAALCIADYLADTKWGFRAVYGTEIPLPSLIAAINICDETIPLASGMSEKRYSCNGGFALTMKRGEVLQNMLTSCAGRITYSGGQFNILPAAWRGSTFALSDLSMFAGPIRWKSKLAMRDLVNGVKGTYISPTNNWQPADIPAYAQDALHGYGPDANLAIDGGDRRWFDLQLPFTISPAAAQRLCKIELLRRRQQGTGTLALNMVAYQLQSQDIISVTLPTFGWAGKLFEVSAHRFKLDKQQVDGVEVTLLGTEIDIQETDPTTYDWSAAEELSPQGYQQAITPSMAKPAPPTWLTLSSDLTSAVLGVDGVTHSRIFVSWNAPLDAHVTLGGKIELQDQVATSPASLDWNGIPPVAGATTSYYISGVVDGTSWNVRIRSVNVAGVPSAWVSAGPVIVGGGAGGGLGGVPAAQVPGFALSNVTPFVNGVQYARDVSQGLMYRLSVTWALPADPTWAGEEITTIVAAASPQDEGIVPKTSSDNTTWVGPWRAVPAVTTTVAIVGYSVNGAGAWNTGSAPFVTATVSLAGIPSGVTTPTVASLGPVTVVWQGASWAWSAPLVLPVDANRAYCVIQFQFYDDADHTNLKQPWSPNARYEAKSGTYQWQSAWETQVWWPYADLRLALYSPEGLVTYTAGINADIPEVRGATPLAPTTFNAYVEWEGAANMPMKGTAHTAQWSRRFHLQMVLPADKIRAEIDVQFRVYADAARTVTLNAPDGDYGAPPHNTFGKYPAGTSAQTIDWYTPWGVGPTKVDLNAAQAAQGAALTASWYFDFRPIIYAWDDTLYLGTSQAQPVTVAANQGIDASRMSPMSLGTGLNISGGQLVSTVTPGYQPDFTTISIDGASHLVLSAVPLAKLTDGLAKPTTTGFIFQSASGKPRIYIDPSGVIQIDDGVALTSFLKMTSSGIVIQGPYTTSGILIQDANAINKVLINSSGVSVIGAGGTLNMSGTGLSVTSGSNTFTVTSALLTLTNSGGAFLQCASDSMKIGKNGSTYLAMMGTSSTQVTFLNGAGGVLGSLSNSWGGGFRTDFAVVAGSGGIATLASSDTILPGAQVKAIQSGGLLVLDGNSYSVRGPLAFRNAIDAAAKSLNYARVIGAYAGSNLIGLQIYFCTSGGTVGAVFAITSTLPDTGIKSMGLL